MHRGTDLLNINWSSPVRSRLKDQSFGTRPDWTELIQPYPQHEKYIEFFHINSKNFIKQQRKGSTQKRIMRKELEYV